MGTKKVTVENGEYHCDIDISVAEWKQILQDNKLLNNNYKRRLIQFYIEPNHKSTCEAMSAKYGEHYQSFNGTIMNFGKAVQKKLNRFKIIGIDGKFTYWIIPMQGRNLPNNHFEWTLRPELVQAMEELGMTKLADESSVIFNLIARYKVIAKSKGGLKGLDELYKWQLVTQYQSKPDVNAPNFTEEIQQIKFGNLIYKIAIGTIAHIAKAEPEQYRKAIRILFDEKNPLQNRLSQFISGTKAIYKDMGEQLQSHHDERTASVFLTYHNPLKYTVYKDDIYKFLCNLLHVEPQKAGHKYTHYLELLNKYMLPYISADNELQEMTNKETADYIHSDLLLAQTILWVCNNKSENKNLNNTIMNSYIKLLQANHNIVLTGAPGTGKTYLAKQIAAQMILGKPYSEELEKNETFKNCCKFVQFHPSYDYTDFVEGLRPKSNENGNIGFDRRDGVFKAFCKKALKNWIDSQKSEKELQQIQSLRDRISDFLSESIENNTEFKTISGTKFFVKDISEANILISIPENKISSEIKVSQNDLFELLDQKVPIAIVKDIRKHFGRQFNTQQDSYTFILCNEIRKIKDKTKSDIVQSVVPRENFVFIIDEINRGEISKIFGELFFAIDPSYRGEKGLVQTQYQNMIEDGDTFKKGFYVPENVYIIGTMNDIDRSVESMDFAMRRRFLWKEITAVESAENMNLPEESKERMKRLNEEISKIEGLNSAYHIGGAYFLKLQNDNYTDLWNYHLEPLLKEYLRGQSDEAEKLQTLKNAYDLKSDNN